MESLDPRIVIGVLVALAVVLIAVVLTKKRRSEELRGKFGPEYERLVRERGDARHAERELDDRVQRVKQLHLKPPPTIERGSRRSGARIKRGSWMTRRVPSSKQIASSRISCRCVAIP
jgi:hypothetical protein